MKAFLNFQFDLGRFQDNINKVINYVIGVENEAKRAITSTTAEDNLLRKIKAIVRRSFKDRNYRVKGATYDIVEGFRVRTSRSGSSSSVLITHDFFEGVVKRYNKDQSAWSQFNNPIEGSDLLNLFNYGREPYTIPGPNENSANPVLKWRYGGKWKARNWPSDGSIFVGSMDGLGFMEEISSEVANFTENLRQKIKDKINSL